MSHEVPKQPAGSHVPGGPMDAEEADEWRRRALFSTGKHRFLVGGFLRPPVLFIDNFDLRIELQSLSPEQPIVNTPPSITAETARPLLAVPCNDLSGLNEDV